MNFVALKWAAFQGNRVVKKIVLSVYKTNTTCLQHYQLSRNINWSSPESLTESSTSKCADVWSLALVLSEIFSGQVPFDSPEFRDLTFDEFCKRIESGVRPEIPRKISDAYPWLLDMVNQLKLLLISPAKSYCDWKIID